MFRHLLVPLDGSRLAEAALPVAGALARRLRARVTLLHVLERTAPAAVHGEPHLTGTAEAHAYVTGAARRFALEGVATAGVVEPEQTDVARTISESAGRLGADLVVVCSHGRSGLRGLLFGRVAQQVLGGGMVPVLLVRPDGAPARANGRRRPFACRRIMVPLDGTKASEAALPAAAVLAGAFEAEVLLINVVPTLMTVTGDRAAATSLLPSTAAAVLDAEAERAHVYLASLAAALTQEGLKVDAEVQRGEPGQVLLAAARSGVDLVVMATHGRAGITAVWAGSVAARFLETSPVPVLLIRTAAGS